MKVRKIQLQENDELEDYDKKEKKYQGKDEERQ
jgi:hypothetical protein